MQLEHMRPSAGYLIVRVDREMKNCTSLVVCSIVKTDSEDRDPLLMGREILVPVEDGGDHFWEQTPKGEEFHYALIKEDVIRVFSTEEPEKKK